MIEENNEDKPEPIEERLIRWDNKEFYAEITAIPMVFNGEPVMQILLNDITDRKKIRDRVGRFGPLCTL